MAVLRVHSLESIVVPQRAQIGIQSSRTIVWSTATEGLIVRSRSDCLDCYRFNWSSNATGIF